VSTMWTPVTLAVDRSVDNSVENLGWPGENSRHPVDILGMAKTAENDCRKALVHPSVTH
jgi:hypothetical protein